MNDSAEKHFCFRHAGGIRQEIQHKAAPSCSYGGAAQGVEGESFSPRGEAVGSLLPLNVSGRFMDMNMHFGRGIEETKLVIAAFAPDWLGHLSSSLAAKQHLPLLALMHTADKSPGKGGYFC